MRTYYSPLRYPGGKNCIFPFISSLFYENQLIGIEYAEPYAGGAGLALRLLFEGYVEHIHINDLDKSIYAFWCIIIDRPDEFCRWIEEVEVSVKNWNKYKEIQNQAESINKFELAKSTLFLNRTNISGIIQGGVIGGQEQRGKYKINARFNKPDLIHRIKKIAGIKNRISVSNHDGIEFIEELNKRSKETFIYLDPPYFQKGADLYMNFYSKEDHKRLSKKVHQLNKKWIISYDNNEFILNLYTDKNKLAHKLSQSASNRVGDEIFIFSEEIDFIDSISLLKSPMLLS